ncbi:metalloregulator ArsR/SmtB family transcription factor [Candidatus Nitronereus thalassa]|uniref:Metalloregulator ArsR/SmtB family transcription factor n=1 Tax=Candidatus Nitronereus thalassa TaxID=3020898 RepID=A0ABU3K9Y0_9BACT|nr:metalloregulator ArsR/SmtB family transcription factor [Candidatus Nitronereus thalassa]MDT7043200.1 metalloregulator ArsR/SmtB family transcription factor [Candidatus Nitronereus thalassa]
MKPASISPSCVDKLKLLADPTRLAVLESLMDQPRRVGELVSILEVEQSLLSHHLALLREAGLVDALRKGKAVLYQLSSNVGNATTGKALDLGCCQLSFSSSSKKGNRT